MAMAQSLQYLYLVVTILLVLSLDQATSTSHGFSKSLHFTLYQHDTLNKTSFLIVNGVAGPGVTPTTSPFGSLFVNQDNLTVKPDPSSKVVGVAEGFSITTSFDGLSNLAVQRVILSYKNLNGSISFFGNGDSIKLSDIPVSGGTGDFLFVQGYVTSSLFDAKGFVVIYKAEFHLYWPPYAK